MALSRYGLATLMSVQAIGLGLALLLIALTFVRPEQIVARLKTTVVEKVEAATSDRLKSLSITPEEEGPTGAMRALANRFGLDAAELRKKREALVPALTSLALGDEACDSGCTLRGVTLAAQDSALAKRLVALNIGQTTLGDFIVGKYETTLQGLITDLRRFGMVNAVVLGLLMLAIPLRRHIGWRLVVLSLLVTGYTVWAMQGYFLDQDWGRTLLFNDWAAPAYQFTMIVVCLLLIDWVLLSGIITRGIFDYLTSAAH